MLCCADEDLHAVLCCAARQGHVGMMVVVLTDQLGLGAAGAGVERQAGAMAGAEDGGGPERGACLSYDDKSFARSFALPVTARRALLRIHTLFPDK